MRLYFAARLLAVAGMTAPLLPAVASTASEPSLLRIGQVQGTGERSPLLGQEVRVEGIVTADFRQGLGGFVLQDIGDDDARTSDALFVLLGFHPDADDGESPRVGDRYQVQGRVIERQVGGSSVTALEPAHLQLVRRGEGVDSLPLTELTAPPPAWEALENMRVRINAALTVTSTDQLDKYGELAVRFGDRLWQATEVAQPGSAQYQQVLDDNRRRALVVDDGSDQRDPAIIAYLGNRMAPASGATLQALEGIVDQRHKGYRLQLTTPLQWTPPASTALIPPAVAGSLRIASFNLENMFNGDGRGGGFPTVRGARSLQQLQVQTSKLVATLRALDADIAALMELENDGYGPESSLAQFVDALNADGSDWRFVDAGHGPGIDTIRVGLIYRASRVQPLGPPAVLEVEPFGQRSRVPLAQAFRRGDGPSFVVVANHFKSKGCSEAEGADADQGDGQGCWNALRLRSAQQLDAWLKTDPTGHGERTVLVGDFNAYAMEDPLRWLRAQGWRDAIAEAGIEHPYSFIYAGMSGRLDHALLSPALAGQLRGAAEWHINADAPDSAGYAHGGDPTSPIRSSDHDPLLLGFDL
ncbi:ExeM/NucH family extracellular endonuclease [Pseudoxanthomonas dokdonensis]|nr:ExeM/NucH family extracellular endonuclease [Pseudoxanthomonas dokdonensis]